MVADDLITILVVGLAAAYMIRAWVAGSIFATIRSWLEDEGLSRKFGENFLTEKITQLLLCPLCLAFWTCLTLSSLSLTFSDVGGPIEFLVGVFASATIAVSMYRLISI